MENTYELMYMSRMGDDWSQKALFFLFEPVQKAAVNTMVASYRPVAIYRDDMLQEAMITLYQAAELFREDQYCSFRTFLSLVTQRRICSLLRHYSAATLVQMHNVIYFEDHVSEEASIYDTIPQTDMLTDPQYSLSYHEAGHQVRAAVARLSAGEREALEAFTTGKTYREACQALGITYKTYDGRLQRARKKIKDAIHGQ